MKVALFIFRFGPSHGSILQTYALTRTLERLGHDVTIIDRQKPTSFRDCITCLKRVTKGIINRNLSWHDFYLDSFSQNVMRNLNAFIKKELGHQTITLTRNNKLKRIGKENYDAFIVGSDQTWRPRYVYNIYNYYLDFVSKDNKARRIAYAVSFGTSEWEYNSYQEKRCKELVQRFNGVSVREKDGVTMCKSHYCIEAYHVLDPTMLLEVDDYYKIIGDHNREGNSYVGYNYLDVNEDKIKLTNYISNILELPTKQINAIEIHTNSRAGIQVAPSIKEWLENIAHSEFVITDSFHATVFAIIFHKKFFTIGNEKRGLSRFTSLLSMLGIEERLITDIHQITEDNIKNEIDWTTIDEKINVLKHKSICFLRSNLLQD